MSDTNGSPSLLIGGRLEEKGVARLVSVLGSFLLHAFVALIVGPMIVFVVLLAAVVLFDNSHAINPVLKAGGVLNPLLWGPGLILGLLVNRFVLKSTACWVWLVGMAWIVCGILAAFFSYHTRFSGICSPFENVMTGFFSFDSNYCGGGEKVMRFTLPTFSSIAYSLGAWVALRFGRSRAHDALNS